MNAGRKKALAKNKPQDFEHLFGPAPVLSWEDADRYQQALSKFLDILQPADFLEQMLVRDVAVATWEIIRIDRYKALTVELNLERLVQQRSQTTQQESFVRQVAHAASSPDQAQFQSKKDDARRAIVVNDVVCATVANIDKFQRQKSEDLDHARAFERSAQTYEQLVGMQRVAIARRNDALEQLECYRKGMGRRAQEVSRGVIETQAHGLDQLQGSLVPATGEDS